MNREVIEQPIMQSIVEESFRPMAASSPSKPALAPAPTAPAVADLLDLLKCPVCYESATIPIFQCHSGHLIGSECKPKLQRCPTCRDKLGNTRNFGLEALANQIQVPCKYAVNGCKAMLPFGTRQNHEQYDCEWKTFKCVHGAKDKEACEWEGTLEEVVLHLEETHGAGVRQGTSVVHRLEGFDDDEWDMWDLFQSCFGNIFMIRLYRSKDDLFYATVVLIGRREEAGKFTYEFGMVGVDPRKWLRYRDVPVCLNSFREGWEIGAFQFDMATAKKFSEDDGKLPFRVSIGMDDFRS
jgi:E3 ubiquitin-protein ligase SIAH1